MTNENKEIKLMKKVVRKFGDQEKAAEALGKSQASMSRYLSGKVHPTLTVIILATLLTKKRKP